MNERDVLGAQLIRRNDELALLQERMKMLETTLKKGEKQYQERLDEIRIAKNLLQDSRRELNTKNGESDNEDRLTKELAQKEIELLQEKVKVKALSEELENPLNVHRWRKLEGSDPVAYEELIQKIDLLQKRLIKKSEQVSTLCRSIMRQLLSPHLTNFLQTLLGCRKGCDHQRTGRKIL